MPTRIYAVANYKGGTAKTTTSLNLAYAAHARGQRVLLIDADSSANATVGVDVEPAGKLPPLLLALGEQPDQTLSEGVVRCGWGFDVLPSGKRLSFVNQFLEEMVEPSRALQPVFANLGDYDTVIVDCPAQFGVMTRLVLAAAHEVIVPIDCKSADSLVGLTSLWRDVVLVQQKDNAELVVRAVLPCRADRTRLSNELLDQLATHPTFGPLVPRLNGELVVIRESVGVAEARMRQVPVALHDPDGRGTQDFNDMAETLWGQP